jgi:putative cardiolipin synthase
VSIDAQYFLIKPDRAGSLFAAKMLKAADRGVRVRLLLDDIFTPQLDRELTVLNSHPNIQVRLFNPIGNRSLKYVNYLLDFRRANRRMHNKSFTVDGAMSIVGGRNIAEEYFELQSKVTFDDFEVLTMGAVVDQIGVAYDLFWNSELAVPMEAFSVKHDPQELQQWRHAIATQANSISSEDYQRAINSPLVQKIINDETELIIAGATLITDSPEKLQNAQGNEALATLAVELRNRLNAAKSQILIITPYLVPRKDGVEAMERLRAKGIRIAIVTNSLASNNHLVVHSGYARYRKRMLKAGVELYEIKADALDEWESGSAQPELLTLHTKAIVFDRSTVVVGSMNFDPRSLVINSEMGLFIESDGIAERFIDAVDQSLSAVSYRVSLDENGNLTWTYDNNGVVEVETTEPLASLWQRFKVGFYRTLPIESQL